MQPSDSSGLKSADAAILARPGRLMGLHLLGNGTDACSVVLYDNASAASGKELAKLALKTSAGDLTLSAIIPDGGIVCNNGIYADLTDAGTAARYIVHYIIG